MPVTKTLTVGGNTYDFAYKTSDLTNDSGFVNAAGAAAAAPVQSVNGETGVVVLNKGDIGLGNVDNVQQYSASNPPPYPVTSVNTKTGAVVLGAEDVGAATPSDLYSFLPVDSASGAIASFPDGADSVPVEALSVVIEPVQDLHGQTSPWPAGGGKNQADITRLGGLTGWSVDSSGFYRGQSNQLYSNFAPSKGGFINWMSADSVTISCYMYTPNAGSSSPWDVCALYDDGTNGAYYGMGIYTTATYASRTFTAPTGKKITGLAFGYGTSTTLYVKDLQIESGSTATTYAPYSNICPITGWSDAKVTRTGKNLYSYYNLYDGYWLADGFHGTGNHLNYDEILSLWAFIKIPVEAGETITISQTQALGGTYSAFFGNDPTDVISTFLNAGANSTRTVPAGAKWLGLCIHVGSGDDPKTQFPNAQVEIGSTATAFEDYTAATVTVDLDGSRYGGSLNVLTGELTVDRVIHEFHGESSEAWVRSSTYNGSFYINTSTSHNRYGVICSHLAYAETLPEYAYGKCYLDGSTLGNINVWIMEPNTTVTQFTTFLSTQYANGTPLQVVCKLATPLTVQLDANTLTTLLGQNNVWANCGDVEVSYRADIQLYIEKKLS